MAVLPRSFCTLLSHWEKQTVKLVLKLRDLASNQYQPMARLDIHALGITAIEILCCSVMAFILGICPGVMVA